MDDPVDVRYEVPASEPAVLTNMGIPLDEVEDLLLESAAYRQASRVLLPKLNKRQRPPTAPPECSMRYSAKEKIVTSLTGAL